MKSLFFAALLSFMAALSFSNTSFASFSTDEESLIHQADLVNPSSAEQNLEAIPGAELPELVYMSLGVVPYNSTATGRLTLSNRGPGLLTGIKYSIRGMGFRASDNCPKELAVGASCRIKITYWNTFGGSASADMFVKTSDKSYQVTITATGLRDPWNGTNPGNPTFPPNPRFPRP